MYSPFQMVQRAFILIEDIVLQLCESYHISLRGKYIPFKHILKEFVWELFQAIKLFTAVKRKQNQFPQKFMSGLDRALGNTSQGSLLIDPRCCCISFELHSTFLIGYIQTLK